MANEILERPFGEWNLTREYQSLPGRPALWFSERLVTGWNSVGLQRVAEDLPAVS